MDTPPELAALLAAYVTATGYHISLSYERRRVLSDLHSRGICPDDITAICRELQRLIKCGAKGYGPSSLEFRNAIGDPDRTEERALRIRQMAHARKPKPQIIREQKVGSDVFHVLDDPTPSDVPSIDVRGSLLNLANSLKQQSA